MDLILNENFLQPEDLNPKPKKSTTVINIIINVLLILMVALIYFYFVFVPIQIIGASMEDNFYDGEQVLVQKYMYSLEVGDVVIVGKDSTNSKSKQLIKRLIGTGGDSLAFYSDGKNVHLYIKRAGESEYKEKTEDYIKEEMRIYNISSEVFSGVTIVKSLDDIKDENAVILAKDEVFVMGDNRNISSDSRSLGKFKRKLIYGKVQAKLLPDTALYKIFNFLFNTGETDND